MEKSKTTLFSQTFEVAENKVPLFFSFLAEEPAPGVHIHYDSWTLNFAFWKLGLNPIYNTYL